MLKLKLQYFGHLMRRVDSLETSAILQYKIKVLKKEKKWDNSSYELYSCVPSEDKLAVPVKFKTAPPRP